MASQRSIFPVRDEVDREVPSRTLSLAEAGDVVEALTSEVARKLVDRVHEEPGTASDLAAAVDTSLQNAQYHLNSLQGAGVVEVVDTWYSERGKEMNVYAPTTAPLLIVAGRPDGEAAVRQAMSESPPADEGADGVAVRSDGGPDAAVQNPR
ncbi:ArsR/SmtB family transcription factor [Natronomonas marina]|uniref:ArsR/SmtB family transcription factor n=1 Tax=Natronomonas marina TaxID=2961939 RepID=UPI0020C9D5CA|nr:winged helix-turn-helix domain-containing protein [Natronomonas marina]